MRHDMEPATKKPRNEKDGNNTSFDDIEELSATEYLAQVSKQAKSMPIVFVDDKKRNGKSLTSSQSKQKRRQRPVPIDGTAASLSYLLSKRTALAPPPSPRHLPEHLEEWISTVVANFEQLRNYLEECANAGVGGRKSKRQPLPPMKDRDAWHVFCVGERKNGMEENPASASLQLKSDKEPASATFSIPPWRVNLPKDGYTPTTQLLCQMDQVMVRRVLAHMTHFVHANMLCEKLYQWLYALLARLKTPIHRDDAAIMFGLLKDLCLARSKVDCDKKEIADAALRQLNTLITLIGVYFEQGGGVAGVMTCKA